MKHRFEIFFPVSGPHQFGIRKCVRQLWTELYLSDLRIDKVQFAPGEPSQNTVEAFVNFPSCDDVEQALRTKTDDGNIKLYRSSEDQLEHRCNPPKPIQILTRTDSIPTTPNDPKPSTSSQVEEWNPDNINADWIKVSSVFSTIDFKPIEPKAVMVTFSY